MIQYVYTVHTSGRSLNFSSRFPNDSVSLSLSTKGGKDKEEEKKSGKEKKEKKEKILTSTPEAKAGAKEKLKDDKTGEVKEKPPKPDKKKEEKSKGEAKLVEQESSKERELTKEGKIKENNNNKGEKSAVASLKSPVPRSEGLESERGEFTGFIKDICYLGPLKSRPLTFSVSQCEGEGVCGTSKMVSKIKTVHYV